MNPKHLLLVTYTLYPPQNAYEDVVNRLERDDTYEIDETSWLIYTEETARWWYAQLDRLLVEDDELAVFKISIDDFVTDEGVEEDLERWLSQRGLWFRS